MHHFGCNFSQRGEDEAAFGHARVREGERGGVEDGVGGEEEIEVEGAGAVGGGVGAVASEGAFDGEKFAEDFGGRAVGLEQQCGVEEVGLVGEADGRGAVEGGDGGDASEGTDAGDGGAEIFFAVSEVGAERDGGGVGGVQFESSSCLLPFPKFLEKRSKYCQLFFFNRSSCLGQKPACRWFANFSLFQTFMTR